LVCTGPYQTGCLVWLGLAEFGCSGWLCILRAEVGGGRQAARSGLATTRRVGCLGSILPPPLLPQPRQRALKAPQGEGEPLGMQGCQHRCVTRAGSQGRFQVVDDLAQPGGLGPWGPGVLCRQVPQRGRYLVFVHGVPPGRPARHGDRSLLPGADLGTGTLVLFPTAHDFFACEKFCCLSHRPTPAHRPGPRCRCNARPGSRRHRGPPRTLHLAAGPRRP